MTTTTFYPNHSSPCDTLSDFGYPVGQPDIFAVLRRTDLAGVYDWTRTYPATSEGRAFADYDTEAYRELIGRIGWETKPTLVVAEIIIRSNGRWSVTSKNTMAATHQHDVTHLRDQWDNAVADITADTLDNFTFQDWSLWEFARNQRAAHSARFTAIMCNDEHWLPPLYRAHEKQGPVRADRAVYQNLLADLAAPHETWNARGELIPGCRKFANDDISVS